MSPLLLVESVILLRAACHTTQLKDAAQDNFVSSHVFFMKLDAFNFLFYSPTPFPSFFLSNVWACCFDLIIVLFSLFGGFLVWLSADRLLSAPSDLSQFLLLLLFLVLFMLLLMSCAWNGFIFSLDVVCCLSADGLLSAPLTSPSLCCCCYCFLAQSFCCNFFCCYWCHVLEIVLFFSLGVVWLSDNGLLSTPPSPLPVCVVVVIVS